MTALMLAGCGKHDDAKPHAVYPAEGQVIWKGKPLADAHVTFFPQDWKPDKKNNYPSALTAADGRFHLTTHKRDDGAPAGKYTILVTYHKMVPVGPGAMPGPNVLPKKYEHAETSDLEVELAAGSNVVPPIDLGGKPDEAKEDAQPSKGAEKDKDAEKKKK
jgi:hypothetical protein